MDKLSFDDAVNNIEPPEIPDDSSEKRGPRLDLTEKEKVHLLKPKLGPKKLLKQDSNYHF